MKDHAMEADGNVMTRWLPASLAGRYRLGLVALAFLFLFMSVPYVLSADAPLAIRIVTIGMYAVIALRWSQWFRGSEPLNLDHGNEILAFWLTASITGDAYASVTPLWAAACLVPVFIPLRRLAVVLTGYTFAFLSGLAFSAADPSILLDAQVITQPPTIAFTAGMVYFFSRVLTRQQNLIEENESNAQKSIAGERRFRSLVESLPGAIVTSTPEGGLRYISPQLERILGYPAHYLSGGWGSLIAKVVHEDDQQTILDAMMEGIRTHSRVQTEIRIINADGETIWVHLDSILVDDGSPDAPVWQTLVFDVTERHSLTEQLTHQAFHDALTGLPNRLLFDDRVSHALERSSREITTTAVCFIDLDNFKIVNDSLGHKYGDLLVIEVGQRLRSCLRQGDTVARLGGDEFALLLEGQRDTGEAIAVAERILEHLAAPFDIDGQPVYTSASIGIAYAGDASITGAELIRHADVAMYEAKRKGKGRYEIFEPYMEAYARQRLDLEVELRTALTGKEFRVVYQPIVNLSTGTIDEVEALIRWQHPTRGMLPPSEFLPTAEETGLIVPIGHWLLNEACRKVRDWQSLPGYEQLMLSVNLSPRQLHDDNLANDISNALERSGLEPRMLQLEVAESAMLADVEHATHAINELTTLGVRIAIDDFGTGNSSLGHLRRLPVNTLKIDRSYVMELGKSDQGTTMLRAMVTLGKTLGMDVTAEGIETIEQTALRDFGCDYGQGYYFAKPLSEAAMNALLDTQHLFPIMDNRRLSIVSHETTPDALAAG